MSFLHFYNNTFCNQLQISGKFLTFLLSVVLGDSPLSNEGRIDIFNGDLWSSAISNSFNIQVAEVACRELGFPGALSNYITPSNGVSTFKNIACHGDEDSLSECRHTAEHRNQSFDAFNVLGVICESRK